MSKRYNQGIVNEGGPGVKYRSVTPNDDTDLPDGFARAFWIGVAGNIVLTDITDNDETFTVSAGPLPVGAKRVKATGTTATGIIAIYE